MDKLIYSISKSDMNTFVLENVTDNQSYKFNNFSEIVEVFTGTDNPQLIGFEQGKVTNPSTNTPANKIDIHKRVVNTLNESNPKYFWSQAQNKFDHVEKGSVKDVLKHVQQSLKGW